MGKDVKRTSKPQRSSKNKKIKAVDPFYKGPRTADRKLALANEQPKKQDVDLYLPGSQEEVMWLKQQAAQEGQRSSQSKSKKNKFKNKKSPHAHDFAADPQFKIAQKGMSRPLKPVPSFKHQKGETEKDFLKRVERETQAVINRSKIEDAFNVEVKEPTPGTYIFEKRHDILEDMKAEDVISKRKKRNKKKDEKRKEARVNKMKEKVENFEEFKDEVKFGEVAMAPPSLTAKPRNIPQGKTNRPGTKSLLLNDMMKSGKQGTVKTSAPRAIGQGVKRKHLSFADQRILDAEREKAITLYRQIKKRKTEH